MTTSIKNQEVEQGACFKQGDLVCNADRSLVVIVTAETHGVFQGVIIYTPNTEHLGSYVSNIRKIYYKPFKGEITLKSI